VTLKEKILVLKKFKYGEADVVVHGLNPLGARMNFFARGGMKSRKRFAGGILEPTHYIEVTYKPGSGAEGDPLHSLLEANLIREFPKLRTDYDRLEAALYLLRLVHKLGQQGVVDSPDLFNLLGNALQAAETSDNLENLKLQFELKLLAAQGVLPHDESFLPWLRAGMAEHGEMKIENHQRQRLLSEAHAHLRHYLGTF
jgi:DNA repair protein RecO (recombination protein O)